MTIDEIFNLIDWLKDLLLRIEAWFHDAQGWLFGEDTDNTWPGRLIISDSDAAAAAGEE